MGIWSLPSTVRTSAKSTRGHWMPPARSLLNGRRYELAPTTAVCAHAHAEYSKRYRDAYGRHRLRAQTPLWFDPLAPKAEVPIPGMFQLLAVKNVMRRTIAADSEPRRHDSWAAVSPQVPAHQSVDADPLKATRSARVLRMRFERDVARFCCPAESTIRNDRADETTLVANAQSLHTTVPRTLCSGPLCAWQRFGSDAATATVGVFIRMTGLRRYLRICQIVDESACVPLRLFSTLVKEK